MNRTKMSVATIDSRLNPARLLLYPCLFFFSLSSAFPAAAAGVSAPFSDYVKTVSDHANRDEDEVRRDSLAFLRGTGRFSEDELARIGRGENIDAEAQREAVALLKGSDGFKSAVGLAAVRDRTIEAGAGEAFASLRNTELVCWTRDLTVSLSADRSTITLYQGQEKHSYGVVRELYEDSGVTYSGRAGGFSVDVTVHQKNGVSLVLGTPVGTMPRTPMKCGTP